MVLSGFLNEQMKIVVIKTCDLQESTQKQFNKIRKPIHKQNEKFNREVEITKKNQTEILELKNTTKVMNNKKENINRRIYQPKKESVKQKRDYLKLSSLRAKKKKKKKKKRMLKAYMSYRIALREIIYVIQYSK